MTTLPADSVAISPSRAPVVCAFYCQRQSCHPYFKRISLLGGKGTVEDAQSKLLNKKCAGIFNTPPPLLLRPWTPLSAHLDSLFFFPVVKRLEFSWLALRHSAKLTCICLGDLHSGVEGGRLPWNVPIIRAKQTQSSPGMSHRISPRNLQSVQRASCRKNHTQSCPFPCSFPCPCSNPLLHSYSPSKPAKPYTVNPNQQRRSHCKCFSFVRLKVGANPPPSLPSLHSPMSKSNFPTNFQGKTAARQATATCGASYSTCRRTFSGNLSPFVSRLSSLQILLDSS